MDKKFILKEGNAENGCSMEDVRAEADVREAARILSALPAAERRVAAALVRGYALAIESGFAG